jgi:hypothetical protein
MSKPLDAWGGTAIDNRARAKKVPHALLWLLSLALVLGLELWGMGGLELRDALTPLSLAPDGIGRQLLALSPLILMNLLIVWVIKGWFAALWEEEAS